MRATDQDGLEIEKSFSIDVLNEPEHFVFNSRDEDVQTGVGGDTIELGTGGSTLKGSLENLYGDTVYNFNIASKIEISDVELERTSFSFSPEAGKLYIDADGDDVFDGEIALAGSFTGGDFMAVTHGGVTTITYEKHLPTVREGTAVDLSAVNGINNQLFLTGDGQTDFRVTMDAGMTGAGFQNALGVYEIDEDGNLVDVRILFANAQNTGQASATISDIEANHELGFFIVQNGADWAQNLTSADVLEFRTNGNLATVDDGANLRLTVNGSDADQTVFHSYRASLNQDGLQHALSGVVPGGQSIMVGFEDMTGGGDQDYQDLIFRVDELNFV